MGNRETRGKRGTGKGNGTEKQSSMAARFDSTFVVTDEFPSSPLPFPLFSRVSPVLLTADIPAWNEYFFHQKIGIFQGNEAAWSLPLLVTKGGSQYEKDTKRRGHSARVCFRNHCYYEHDRQRSVGQRQLRLQQPVGTAGLSVWRKHRGE